MLMTDYTAKLLNLEDVIITNVENIADQLHIYLELPRIAHTCPACGATTDRIHDYRMQTIKDLPLARDTFLHLRKRRYRCSCGKRFFEKNTFLPRFYRVTSRLVAEIIFSFKKIIPAKEIGSRFNVSAATAMRFLTCSTRNQPCFRKWSLWTSLRAIPVDKSITVSLRIPKKELFLISFPIVMRMI